MRQTAEKQKRHCQRQHPEVQLQVVQRTSREIIEALDSGDLDAGLVCPPPHLPRSLQATSGSSMNSWLSRGRSFLFRQRWRK